jgi:hypothetical protein
MVLDEIWRIGIYKLELELCSVPTKEVTHIYLFKELIITLIEFWDYIY